ncbi:MAG: hypothetical protein E7Z75_09760 [Methanobrevibacter olleyae]|uniref:Uncharacterized protein n=1 Tax=Methanobrevibacter olleyae TaxID=294671 RepID=A0A8T3VPJ5_METOL|nr:hypothetical protein [Methanobrevibacter olleyae]
MSNNNLIEKEAKTLQKVEEELSEGGFHINDLKHTLEEFTLTNLKEYCTKEDDDINRIILRASEILVNRHMFEFNLIVNQLVDPELADDWEKIQAFKEMWLKKGLPLD